MFRLPKSVVRTSVRQERQVAMKLAGGRRVAGSGSQPGNKGDVKADRWLAECKYTNAVRYSLNLGLWRKIEKEAIQTGRYPVMVIEIAGRKLAVISFDDFLAVQSSI